VDSSVDRASGATAQLAAKRLFAASENRKPTKESAQQNTSCVCELMKRTGTQALGDTELQAQLNGAASSDGPLLRRPREFVASYALPICISSPLNI